jgi:hypothetical protein
MCTKCTYTTLALFYAQDDERNNNINNNNKIDLTGNNRGEKTK